MFKALVGLIAVVAMQLVYAQAEIAEQYFPIYRNAVISKTETLKHTAWYLPLAKYQKINGVWQFSKALDLQGDVTKVTYLIKTHDLYNNIATFYQTWTGTPSIEVLFSCKNRACGSSNEWANGHFHARNLYGMQNKQRYWALKTATGYIAMYLIERGNGQKFLHIETFTSIKTTKKPTS
ncbi:MAG: DUF4892 domain-containing protein [Pseudomonadales bacterium]|nr:DUF4892 domain-containing protein [Pseudomonadales bacterium]